MGGGGGYSAYTLSHVCLLLEGGDKFCLCVNCLNFMLVVHREYIPVSATLTGLSLCVV